ncbi:arginine N-succinyltransferase [Photobacterium sanctipauli]|uniref:Arginine N-succinyltransferase n=1 Tax=Photobacterium sanctipauli TaxID=1342794 RepID=A0A2T3NSM4_9GAMM|nr:arginine N-succinyltransferase [Photobacterium sanctipauli]PSW19221.1 arginine N-succinyltransferase [Photobacterium sanctipauli]
MLVIRPITAADLPALLQCAEESGHGFTSLPVNDEILLNRIKHSEESFAKAVTKAGPEGYLMVAEDTETGEIAGTTAIEAAIGLDNPFYTYHLSTVVHSSRRLNVHNAVKVLTFGNDYTGVSELCTLFLRPEWREGANGRLLSKCRFLMMAEHPQRFDNTVIAEMRGVSDENGNSPFWEWLKQHFFSIDFTLADYLTGIGKKGFIADLMPKLPIYVNLLSPEAQAVIGEVHEKTRPALRLLEKEGFTCRGYVDIFDAGPTVECDVRNIESVRHSQLCRVEIGLPGKGSECIISNTSFEHFRAVAGTVGIEGEAAVISAEMAKALQVQDGDQVRLITQ